VSCLCHSSIAFVQDLFSEEVQTGMRDPREILKTFQCFEKEKAGKIAKFELQGFLAWPIIKSSLCYKYMREQSIAEQTDKPAQQSPIKKIAKGSIGLLGAISQLSKIYFARKKKAVLFYAKSADKLTKLDGRYFNYVTDGF